MPKGNDFQKAKKSRVSNSRNRVGTTFAVLGIAPNAWSAMTANVVDLTTLSADKGFIIQGDSIEDLVGTSVSNAGDVNGDGFSDVIVGAHQGDDEGNEAAGEAYVIFGRSKAFGPTDAVGRSIIDLTHINTSQGFVIQGDAGNDQMGFSVSDAGDVNGDGFGDLIVGARFGDDGGNAAGEAYVVFGGSSDFGVNVSGRRVIDLKNFNASEGFIIQGDVAADNAAYSVSSAGDVNGDGFDDVILGSPEGNDGGGNVGEAYVVFGGSGIFGVNVSGRQVIDLSSLTTTQGFIIQGDASAGKAGSEVSGIGDINADGFDDVMISAPFADNPASNAGEAYIVFGNSNTLGVSVLGRQVVDLQNLSAAEGFVVQGDASSDQLGRFAFSELGDINDDGIADMVINAPFGDDGALDAGEAYIVFGSTTGFGVPASGRQVVNLATLNPSEGFIVRGATEDDRLRCSGGAGDFNGDGVADLIVGARKHDGGGVDAGASYIIYGGSEPFGVNVSGRQVLDLANLGMDEGVFIQGDSASDDAGQSVSAAGDINGDGFDDIILGAPDGDDGGSDAGEAYVVFGGDLSQTENVPMVGVPGMLVLLAVLIAIGRRTIKGIEV